MLPMARFPATLLLPFTPLKIQHQYSEEQNRNKRMHSTGKGVDISWKKCTGGFKHKKSWGKSCSILHFLLDAICIMACTTTTMMGGIGT